MDTIPFTDFEKVDIRIGTVVKADVPEWSHWVIKLQVDLGKKLGRGQYSQVCLIFINLKFEGKQFLFIVNLKPKKIVEEILVRE